MVNLVVQQPEFEGCIIDTTIYFHYCCNLMSFSAFTQEQEQQEGGVTDEAEPFMGAGRFGIDNILSFSFPDKFSFR